MIKSTDKKGGIPSIVYMIMIGFVLFLITSCAIGGGMIKAFKSYKGSEKSFDTLTDSMLDVANESNNLKLKLVAMEMEKGTAIYIFSGPSELIETRVESHTVERIVVRPDECSGDNVCVCLCKGISLEAPEKAKLAELETKYASYSITEKYYRTLQCDEELSCVMLDNVKLRDEINLADVVSPERLDKIKYSTSYTVAWKGGFSFSRPAKDKATDGMDLVNYESPYADLYVVKLEDGNMGICFDPNCIDTDADN